MKKKLFYILGIDGAGKTTHSQKYVQDKNKEMKIKYIYCQYFPVLLYPVKLFLKHTIMRGTNEFKEYASYNTKKKNYTTKYKYLAYSYSFLWYLDYLWQIWFRLIKNRYWKYDYILIDRFYLDSVINLSCLLQLDTNVMLNQAKFVARFMPTISHYIYLYVSEKTAFKRKTDIQSEEYLRERKTRYADFAKEYGFIMINANSEINNVYKNFTEVMNELIIKPSNNSNGDV